MLRGRRSLVLVLLGLAVVAGGIAAHGHIEAAAFVVRAAGMEGVVRRVADAEAERVTTHEHEVPWRGGTLRGRTFVGSPARRAILLVPGVHASGIDEPRLMTFAREMAATGHPVITAELPDLAAYRITPRTTDMIEDATTWAAREWRTRVPESEQHPGIMGISFAGGLAVVAASRLPGRAAWVLSFGGHGDLPRTLRFLCTGELPDGSRGTPHDYGVVIILLGVADRVVPPDQVDPLRAAIRTFLRASHLDMVDKAHAAQEFARARAAGQELPEPARTFMRWVNERNVAELGPALLPHVRVMGDDPSLSPERNPVPAMPVHLLHGADDNVVPAAESVRLASYLRSRGGVVYQLSSPLITHAEVDRPPGAREIWRLVRFWARPL